MSLVLALLSLGFAGGVSVSLEALSRGWWEPEWTPRGIVVGRSTRARVSRVVFGITAGVALSLAWQSIAMSIAGAASGWLVALATDSDLRSRKIPREPCWLVFAISTVAGFATGSTAGAVSAAIAFFVVGISTLGIALVSKGKLGSGDVRLFLALTPLAWWAGVTGILLGVGLAAVIQISVRAVFALRRIRCDSLPFGPAIGLGILTIVLTTASAISACKDFSGLLTCGSLAP